MEKFSIDELLRHAYAGAILALTVFLAYPNSTAYFTANQDNSALVAISMGAILVLGSLVYVLHRAVVYPFLYYFIYYVICRLAWRDAPRRIIDIDIERFGRRNRDHSMQTHLAEWGSQVHFLYCAFWSILLGLAAGAIVGWEHNSLATRWIAVIGGVLLLAALFHHGRLLEYDREVGKREPVDIEVRGQRNPKNGTLVGCQSTELPADSASATIPPRSNT